MNIIGHLNTKRQVSIALDSAKKRNMALPHMIFAGHPGCGKTSMAKYVAGVCDSEFISVVPETLKDEKSIMSLLDALNYDGYDAKGNRIGELKPSIVFLDEVHNLPMYGQEKLGIIMEDFKVDTGKADKFFWVPYFTVIAATTLAGRLSRPFLNRFKRTFHFEPYSPEESFDIVMLHSRNKGIQITPKAARDIAKRGRGVPRVTVGYLDACRDMSLHLNSTVVTTKVVEKAFDDLNIDGEGFNKVELKILQTLYNSDKPIGLETLALVSGESGETIKNEVEQYLIREGFMVRTGSGRSITALGRNYLEEAGYVGTYLGREFIEENYKRK